MPTYVITDETMRHQCDYRDSMGHMTTKKYVNVRKFNKKRNVEWLPVTQYAPDAGTLFKCFS